MIKVSAGYSPLVSHEIRIVAMSVVRYTIEVPGSHTVVLFSEPDTAGLADTVTLFPFGMSGSVILNRRYIIAQQTGYNVYQQIIRHKNEAFPDPRTTYGAVPISSEQIEGVNSTGGGKRFHEVVEIIPENIKIGRP
jgi:hypothetical protein